MSASEKPDFTEQPITSETVYHGVLLHVLADRVRLPDGSVAVREYVRHPGAAMVIAFVDERTILHYGSSYGGSQAYLLLPSGPADAATLSYCLRLPAGF